MTFNRVFPVDHPEANGPDSHIIKASEGLAMKAVQDLNGPDWKSVAFRAEAIFDLLKQPGAVGIRLHAAHNGHHSTLVGFAVDANGKDIVTDTSIAIENGEQCPPFC